MDGWMDGGRDEWMEAGMVGWKNGSREEWMDFRDVADISSHSTATPPSPHTKGALGAPPKLLVQGPCTTSNITYRGSE